MKKLIFILSIVILSGTSFGLTLPKEGVFKIKKLPDKNILYVEHNEEQGHLSNSLIKLVRYYLLNENDSYEVIFPQLSIDDKMIKGSHYAIGYKGIPQETNEIKTRKLKGGLFASYIYKGNYKSIGYEIRTTFQRILKTGKYAPHNNEEIRLLYWNSIDDNYPKDLITEIQVRVVQLQ